MEVKGEELKQGRKKRRKRSEHHIVKVSGSLIRAERPNDRMDNEKMAWKKCQKR